MESYDWLPLIRLACILGILGGQVQAVVVVGSERRVALGAFALAGLVARAQTIPAEHVETFR